MIKPEDFKVAFLSIYNKCKEEFFLYWYDSKTYTRFILENDLKGFLFQISKELGLEYFKEYWQIDAIMYKEKNTTYFPKNSTYAEYLSVAVEHENIANYSHNEINKLSFINSPLKVLITYPLNKDKGKLLLLDYADILKRADIFDEFSTSKRHLVVFGLTDKEDKHNINWEFYIYHFGNFMTI